MQTNAFESHKKSLACAQQAKILNTTKKNIKVQKVVSKNKKTKKKKEEKQAKPHITEKQKKNNANSGASNPGAGLFFF